MRCIQSGLIQRERELATATATNKVLTALTGSMLSPCQPATGLPSGTNLHNRETFMRSLIYFMVEMYEVAAPLRWSENISFPKHDG